jgi:hypothetical protein
LGAGSGRLGADDAANVLSRLMVPSANDPDEIVYLKRHHDDDPNESIPG